MKKSNKTTKLPDFEKMTYEEEALWWDTHSLADLKDEFEPVKLTVSNELTKTISVRMPPDAFIKLKKRARSRGVGLGTLIRVWVLDRLEQNPSPKTV